MNRLKPAGGSWEQANQHVKSHAHIFWSLENARESGSFSSPIQARDQALTLITMHHHRKSLIAASLVLSVLALGCSKKVIRAPGASALEQATADVPSEPHEWFPPLAELAANPAFNPLGRQLETSEKEHLNALIRLAKADLDNLSDEYVAVQVGYAEDQIRRGNSTPYVQGTDIGDLESGEVVVGYVEDSGPRIVRIDSAELPELDALRTQHLAIHEATTEAIRGAFASR